MVGGERIKVLLYNEQFLSFLTENASSNYANNRWLGCKPCLFIFALNIPELSDAFLKNKPL